MQRRGQVRPRVEAGQHHGRSARSTCPARTSSAPRAPRSRPLPRPRGEDRERVEGQGPAPRPQRRKLDQAILHTDNETPLRLHHWRDRRDVRSPPRHERRPQDREAAGVQHHVRGQLRSARCLSKRPGRRLMHHVPPRVRGPRRPRAVGSAPLNAGLSLTSMIDFLVVTVVFLLMTFSASGETPVAKGVNLPKAENTLDMIDAPIVARRRQPDARRRLARREHPRDRGVGSHAAHRRALQPPQGQARAVEADRTRTRTSRASSCSRSTRTSRLSS